MKLRSTLITVLVSLILSCCTSDESEPANYQLEFLILDGTTGKPIKGAEISVLENGRTVKTKKDGTAGFTEKDLSGAGIQAITDSTAYAFSILHPNFRPREINATIGIKTILLMPDSTGTYIYQKPVQFDDGLDVGTLTDAGFDTVQINAMMRKIAQPGYRDLHSILIYKDGHLVLEEYYYGNHDTIDFEGGIVRDKRPKPIWWNRNEKHYIASVNKALTSTLTGIVLDKYEISTDAFIKDYLPEYESYFTGNEKKSAVTFHNALNMTLGFQWNEWSAPDLALLWKSDDFAKFLLSRNNAGPGSAWYYNSASPNVILKCLENIVDEPIRGWAHENFYSKLGITDYKWQSQPDGYPEGAARMYLRPRDMLKIGVAYLDNGKWKGEQVIPESWVQRCKSVQQITTSGRYSHFFWIRELNEITYLSADGDGGNYINIFPEQNMVIVITQGNYLQWPLYVNQANDLMGTFILPAIN